MQIHLHLRGLRPQESLHPGHRIGTVNHNAGHVSAAVIAQDAMDEILIPVQKNRRCCRFSRSLDRLPLTQESFKIIDQKLFADSLGFGANQQSRAWGFDQHTQGPQSVALRLSIDPPGDVHPLAMGLKDQKAARQAEVAGEPGPLGSGGLLHHLHQHLLARLKQFGDANRALLEP